MIKEPTVLTGSFPDDPRGRRGFSYLFQFFIMANATTPPAKKQFLFVRDTVIEAENEEQAKDIFADDSFCFAEGAECYEVCEKCFPHVVVTTCRCAIIP